MQKNDVQVFLLMYLHADIQTDETGVDMKKIFVALDVLWFMCG